MIRTVPYGVSNSELRRLVADEKPGAISAYARCILAARRGTGVRLSASEVWSLTLDDALTRPPRSSKRCSMPRTLPMDDRRCVCPNASCWDAVTGRCGRCGRLYRPRALPPELVRPAREIDPTKQPIDLDPTEIGPPTEST